MDMYTPKEMAEKAVSVGVVKSKQGLVPTFLLGILAGAFIALGACLFITTITGSSFGFGVTRLIGGLAFSLGLILVILAGAELFTGNNLMVIAALSGKVTGMQLIRNWIVVYIGNLLGSALIAFLVFYANQWKTGDPAGSMQVGLTAYKIAGAKLSLSFFNAFVAGILCNALVCLAVWLCYGARSAADKILAIVFPITAFVAIGFEHSVANMFFIPYGIILSRTGEFVTSAAAQSVAYKPELYTVNNFFVTNLLPVTLGNIVGGAIMVGAMYWRIYLKDQPANPTGEPVVSERIEEVIRG